MRKPLHLLLFLLLCCFSISAQQTTTTGPKKKFLSEKGDDLAWQRAELLFEDGHYQLALPRYKKLEEHYPDEPVLMFRLGVIYLNQPENVDKSLLYLSKLELKKFTKTDLALLLGKAYHANSKPDEALVQLNEYALRKNISPANRAVANEYIEYCKNLKEFMGHPVSVQIKNLGAPVNTTNSEYVPIVSADESTMFFTYRGEKSIGGLQKVPGEPNPNGDYFEDIYMSVKDSSGWTEPQSIGNSINTEGHDACMALSGDGQKLFIFQNLPNDPGAIFMSKLDSGRWSVPKELKGDINSSSWEGSVALSADERTLYFSSERPGGYGGRDLYKARLKGDTIWADVTNLGPMINTDKDEDAPFIHPSGAFLLFSSKGHNSMGGFDIFRSDITNDVAFSEVVNLGYPINTPGDDIYYVISADGKRGYYSSGKSGGNGLQDIYISEPGITGKKIVLAQVTGRVTLDDKPAVAKVSVINLNTNNTVAEYTSNASGKYLLNLPAANNYKLVYKLPLLDPIEKTLSAMAVDSFLQSTFDVSFYTTKYLAMLKAKKDSIDKANAPKEGEDMLEDKIISTFGDTQLEGLSFVVQIGAYKLPKNFRFIAGSKFGKVTKTKRDDGITIFTIGSVKTMKEGFVLKEKMKELGVSDAFVTALFKGKRYLLKDLVTSGVLVPSK